MSIFRAVKPPSKYGLWTSSAFDFFPKSKQLPLQGAMQGNMVGLLTLGVKLGSPTNYQGVWLEVIVTEVSKLVEFHLFIIWDLQPISYIWVIMHIY